MKAEEASQISRNNFCSQSLCDKIVPKGRAKKVCQDVLLALATAIILCICALPTIVYFSLTSRSNSSASSSSVAENCTKIQGNDNVSFGCAFFSFGMDYPYDKFSNCSVELYTGSVCSKQLGAWQECTVGNVQDVMLLDLMNSEQSQEERERDAAQFLHYLQSLGSDHCKGTASLFFCQSLFPLCDCESGRSYSSSREECERISMDDCEKEWTSARLYGIPLPNCTELPEEVTSSSVMTEFATLPALNMTNLTCRDDFFEQNFTCLPRCDSWDPRPHNSLTIIDDTIRTLCITLRFLLGGLFLIIFALRRKVLLVIPTVFLLYYSIGFFLFTTLDALSQLGNTNLYCSSKDVIETVASPTLYCKIQGPALTGVLVFMKLGLLIHICLIFFKIAFPILALRSKHYFKWIHLCLLCIEMAIPIMITIRSVVPDGSQVTILSFPPLRCENKGENYFSKIFSAGTTITPSITLLSIIVWLIHKRKEHMAQLKIMFVFFYFMFFMITLNSREAVYLAEYDAFKSARDRYFLCEGAGYVEGRCSRETFEQYSHPILNIAFYLAALFVPIVNLFFVINCRILREKVGRLKILQSLKHRPPRSSQ